MSKSNLVDPDTRTFDNRIHQIESHGGRAPSTVQDIRRVLDDKNVDVVSIATPNHWHALMTIWAAQAGKDVYVEKPCSHNIHEGRIAALAARRYQRIVQHGTQSRSSQEWVLAAAAVQSGSWASCWSLERSATSRVAQSASIRALRLLPRSISTSGSARRRAGLSCQPGPLQLALVLGFRQRRHRQPGGSSMDIARWLIPRANGQSATYPKTVLSLGGRFGYRNQGQTANAATESFEGDAEANSLLTRPYRTVRRARANGLIATHGARLIPLAAGASGSQRQAVMLVLINQTLRWHYKYFCNK